MSSVSEAIALLDLSSVVLLLVTIAVFLVPIFIVFPPIPVERSDALRQTHTKLGVAPQESNLRTQTSPAHGPRPGQAARIQSLHIYPIKSCRGIELARSRVLTKGLEFDRLYAFAVVKPKPLNPAAQQEKRPKWEIATLRGLPLLANVKVDLWLPDASKTSRQLGKIEGAFIVVRFPWRDAGVRGVVQSIAAKLSRGWSAVPEKEFMLPVDFPSQQEITARGYQYEELQFFRKVANALNMKKEVPLELAQYLGAKDPMALFMMDPTRRREVFRNAPRKDELGYQPAIDFQDAYPLHLLSLTSVRALESKVGKDESLQFLDARRFRPNIIVSGLEAYDEDDWRSVRFKPRTGEAAESNFDVSCRTVRCKLPNVDPATGIRHKAEPDHSLRKYRNIDEGAPKNGCFGMQLCPVFQETDSDSQEHLQSLLEVGMEITVLQRGAHLAV